MSALIYHESKLDPANAIFDHVLPSGLGWMHEIKAGQTFRIVDLEDGAISPTSFFGGYKR